VLGPDNKQHSNSSFAAFSLLFRIELGHPLPASNGHHIISTGSMFVVSMYFHDIRLELQDLTNNLYRLTTRYLVLLSYLL
jgi:hypothetical protein